MGFLKRAIRRGVSQAVGNAIGNAVKDAIQPKATELANQAADRVEQTARQTTKAVMPQQTEQQRVSQTEMEGAFARLQSSMESFAARAAENMKTCPGCGETLPADKKFCPSCGSKLPDTTIAEDAICPSCGAQNKPGTKFCAECGTKLPTAVREEQIAQAKREAVMQDWEKYLLAYPKWNCGGTPLAIEYIEAGRYYFTVDFAQNVNAARIAVDNYRQLLLQSGFKQAGQYPSKEHLYKMIGNICYHVDTEHCFDGDPDCPVFYFDREEPYGGFHYVKPEPKKPASFKDLFGL